MNSKYNRRSIRLRDYDYSQEGLYFITICTQNKLCLFGKIENREMILNDAGKMVEKCWLEIPEHYPNVILHKYVIMPNHIHGIIEIVGAQDIVHNRAQNIVPLRNEFQKIIPGSIGSIVRGFKIGVTKWFRKNSSIKNVWQRNYYEHIIRNEESYIKITEYIENNPIKWENDEYYIM